MAESSFELAYQPKKIASFEYAISHYKSVVDTALRKLFVGDSYLSRASYKAISSGGKRIRATLALLSCEATCGSYEKALPVALSFELAHSASLIQDDILDDSSMRHNKPAIHSEYGSVRAILISDYLLFNIFHELSTLEDSGISADRMALILRYVADSAKWAAKGEFSDMLATTKGNITEDEYIETASMKTGSLFAGATAAGAVAGGADARATKAFYSYGHSYGVAFQILDDLLDFLGDPAVTGKPAFKDYENHTSNILLVDVPSSKENSLSRREAVPLESSQIISMLERNGSIEKAAILGQKFCRRAKSHLKVIPDSPSKKVLEYMTYALFSQFKDLRAREKQQRKYR
ncbi:MAG TPA: polyprenyl synthetase family protein [Nitrososphaerales archaeon]|nr:polyprenyl synthetase family protein [Nitrososphaerales archaeon]